MTNPDTDQARDAAELNDADLEQVAGGKLPGKKKPPTLTLKADGEADGED